MFFYDHESVASKVGRNISEKLVQHFVRQIQSLTLVNRVLQIFQELMTSKCRTLAATEIKRRQWTGIQMGTKFVRGCARKPSLPEMP